MIDKLSQYFDLQGEIYSYFGYRDDWRVFPLDDQTMQHWMLVGAEPETGAGGRVAWSEDRLTRAVIETGTTLCGGLVYTQRHLPKWVYRAEKYTLIVVDTQTDGNKFLMVFSNAMECHDEALKALYSECW